MDTQYGEWGTYRSHTLEQNVHDALQDFGGYDRPGIIAWFRTRINQLLPDDTALCGNLFIGPHPASEPRHQDIRDAITQAESEFWDAADSRMKDENQ